jgi:HEAT repeat protein
MSQADELSQRILKCEDWGVVANDILGEFHRGRPVDQLRPLLRSCEPQVVLAASFITDELGTQAAPLLDEVTALLNHQDRHVRGNAIGSILTCASEQNGSSIASVIGLLPDEDWPVRWKAMEFLMRASERQISAASVYMKMNHDTSSYADGLCWLLSKEGGSPQSIADKLSDRSQLVRKFAVVAAARLSSNNEQPLREALSSLDDDVQRFAKSVIDMQAVPD